MKHQQSTRAYLQGTDLGLVFTLLVLHFLILGLHKVSVVTPEDKEYSLETVTMTRRVISPSQTMTMG